MDGYDGYIDGYFEPIKQRMCAIPGCGGKLLKTNTIGYCRKHRSKSLIFQKYKRDWKHTKYNSDEDYKKRQKEIDKKSKIKRKDKIAEYEKKRSKTPERIEANKEYKKSDKGKKMIARSTRKRRAMEAQVEENYTKEQEQATYQAFDNKCFNCKSDKKLSLDHFNPLSRGFALTLKNAIILCVSCNSSKCDDMPEDFFTKEQMNLAKKIMKKAVNIYNKGLKCQKKKKLS